VSVRVLPQRLIVMGVLALVLYVVGSLGAADPAQAAAREEVIVKLNTDLTTIEIINSKYGSITIDDYFASIGVYLLKPPDGNYAETFAQELLKDSPQNGVVYAERNYVAGAPEPPAGDGRMKARAISNLKQDSTNKYAAEYLNLSCAARISTGKGVTVAVLDTGAQLNHPALTANFSGVRRYDFVDNDTKPSEILDANGDGKRDSLAGHGTHMAGIVDRVAPVAKIMPLRVLDSRGRGKVYTIAKAVSFAERNETEVMNLSLGSSQRSVLLQDTIGHAIDRGAVVAAAAGNSDAATPHYPAAGNYRAGISLSPPSTAGLLAVTSVVSFVDDRGYEYERKSDFANYGEWVSIAAPGENYEPANNVWYGIRSAFPIDKYANWSGTSMATPFISGQAALIRSLYEQQSREFEPADIKSKILTSVQEFTAPPKYRNPALNDQYAAWNYSHHDPLDPPNQLGPGHVNVCNSLQQ
jgi:subtilisin family serine protease